MALLSADGAVVDLLGEAVSAIAPVTSLPALSERLRSLAEEAKDVSDTVRDAAEGSEHDPARLEEIRLRRQSLRDLMRKYGDSLSDVIAFGAEARERLNELLGYAERVNELEEAKAVALRQLMSCQKEVGNARRAVAPKLATAVQKRLRQLALPNAAVQVAVGDIDSDPAGESVVFMLAANPGSASQPIAKVASGENWPESCLHCVWSLPTTRQPWSLTKLMPESAGKQLLPLLLLCVNLVMIIKSSLSLTWRRWRLLLMAR